MISLVILGSPLPPFLNEPGLMFKVRPLTVMTIGTESFACVCVLKTSCEPRITTGSVLAAKANKSAHIFTNAISSFIEPYDPITSLSISPAIPATLSVSVSGSKDGSVISDATPVSLYLPSYTLKLLSLSGNSYALFLLISYSLLPSPPLTE